jgi:hypothetical protein
MQRSNFKVYQPETRQGYWSTFPLSLFVDEWGMQKPYQYPVSLRCVGFISSVCLQRTDGQQRLQRPLCASTAAAVAAAASVC